MPDVLANTVSPHDMVATQAEADQKNAEYNALPYNQGRSPQIKYMTMDEVLRRQGEYGAINWYDWATTQWGTKWNAYSHDHYELRWLERKYGEDKGQVFGRVDLRFDTAWSQPTPVFKAIEEKWGVRVHAVTQDEGGFPDVEYGEPYDEELIRKVITFEFESYYDTEVDEPASEVAE